MIIQLYTYGELSDGGLWQISTISVINLPAVTSLISRSQKPSEESYTNMDYKGIILLAHADNNYC